MVREGVRADLEPDDDGMYLRDRADKRMMDRTVHDNAGNGKR